MLTTLGHQLFNRTSNQPISSRIFKSLTTVLIQFRREFVQSLLVKYNVYSHIYNMHSEHLLLRIMTILCSLSRVNNYRLPSLIAA